MTSRMSSDTGKATEAAARKKRAATRCHRGHEFDRENTIWTREGRRRCRRCQYDDHARYRSIRRAQRAAIYARMMAEHEDRLLRLAGY
jgi:hypothetical protein